MSLQAIIKAIGLHGVSATEKLVCIVLANYANERDEAWPSQRRIAEEVCLTPRTVRQALAGLEDKGIISRVQRVRDDGSRGTDLIRLTWGEGDAGGGEDISGGVGKMLPGGGENISGLTTFEPSTEPSIGTNPPVVPPRGDRATRLSEDWEPDGTDKQRAMEAGLNEQEIDRAATEFRNYWIARPGKDARKLDWGRTWHNWCLREANRPGVRRVNVRQTERADALRSHLAGAHAALAERGYGLG